MSAGAVSERIKAQAFYGWRALEAFYRERAKFVKARAFLWLAKIAPGQGRINELTTASYKAEALLWRWLSIFSLAISVGDICWAHQLMRMGVFRLAFIMALSECGFILIAIASAARSEVCRLNGLGKSKEGWIEEAARLRETSELERSARLPKRSGPTARRL